MVREVRRHHTLTAAALLALSLLLAGCSGAREGRASLALNVPRPAADVLLAGCPGRPADALEADLARAGCSPAEAALWTGIVLLASGRTDEAASRLDAALERGLPPALELRCRTALADVAFLRGGTAEAEGSWRALLERDPPELLRFMLMGRIVAARARAGDSAAASAALAEWRSAYPSLTSAYRSPSDVLSALLTALGKGRFVLQLGVFSSRGRADDFRRRMAARGFDCFVHPSGGAWKVLAGPFSGRSEADRAARRFAAAGVKCIMKTWSGR